MIAENVTAPDPLVLFTVGLRNMYAKFTISGLADLNARRSASSDQNGRTRFSLKRTKRFRCTCRWAVFTSLQTGLVQIGGNVNDNNLKAKHFEAAQYSTKTEHEAATNHMWISQKTWTVYGTKRWVVQSANYTLPTRHAEGACPRGTKP